MTPPDPSASGLPFDRLYVPRNLKVPDFVRWAGRDLPGDDDPPGDDPPGDGAGGNSGNGGLSTRLRSVIGPPGCGKSMFLQQLQPALRAGGCRVLWLDIKELVALPDGLMMWLRKTSQRYQMPGFNFDATAVFVQHFTAFLRFFPASPIVLLVDSFEDISPDLREVLETQVFAPFLFPPGEAADNRYVVIARRDEYGLQEALLRWEDDIHELKGIDFVVHDGPMEQIRRRLKAVAEAAPEQAGEILEWEEGDGELPGEAVAHVRGLDDDGRDEFCNGLRGHLTSNPYVNLSLLRQQFRHLDLPLAGADYRVCLEAYVNRAGLPGYAETLIQLGGNSSDDGVVTLTEYQGYDAYAGLLEALMAAGIVAEIPSPRCYRVEPAVCRLVKSPLMAAHA